MAEPVKAAFERTLVTLTLEAILPLRQVVEAEKLSSKYRRIAASIREVGIVEPPVVARPKEGDPLPVARRPFAARHLGRHRRAGDPLPDR